MKCTGQRVVRFLVTLQVVRPFPVISNVRRLKIIQGSFHADSA